MNMARIHSGLRAAVFFGLLILLPATWGCTASENPLIRPEDSIDPSPLLGQWAEQQRELVTISRVNGGYQLHIRKSKDAEAVDLPMRIGKVGNHYFADLHYVDAKQHVFLMVALNGDKLRVILVDFRKVLLADPKLLKHNAFKESDWGVYVTDSTERLRECLAANIHQVLRSEGQDYTRVGAKPDFKDFDLASPRQRNLDYWVQVAAILREPGGFNAAVKDLEELAPDGIDADLVDWRNNAIKSLHALAEDDDDTKAKRQGVSEALSRQGENVRAGLARRHAVELPKVGVDLSETSKLPTRFVPRM